MPDQDDLRSTPYWDVENDSWSPGTAGGNGSSLTLLGPYTVTYEDLDPVSAVFLADLDPGTILVRPMVMVTTPFTANSEKVIVVVSDVSEDHKTNLVQYDAVTDQTFAWGAAEAIPASPGMLGAVIGDEGGHLLAADSIGGNSAGVADIYCLVKPAS